MIRTLIYITFSLVTTLECLSAAQFHWEPCKVQCEKEFIKNDYQQNLILVCHRGCDMFPLALISITQPENLGETEELQGPKALPRIELRTELEETNDIRIEDDDDPAKNSIQSSTKSSTRSPSISDEHPQPCSEHDHHSKDIVHASVQESSKTTVEPTSQPVQDHPVQANEHSTTTNGPKRTQLESMKKDILREFEKEPFALGIRFIQTKVNIVDDEEQISQRFREQNEFENVETKHDDRLELAKNICRNNCMRNYEGGTELVACIIGCDLQARATRQKNLDSNAISLEQPSFRNPLKMVQRIFLNLAGQVSHFVRMSWSSTSSTNHESNTKIKVLGGEDLPPRTQASFYEGFKPRLYVMEPTEKKSTEVLKPGMFHSLKAFKTDFFKFPRLLSHSITLKNSRVPPEVFEIFKNDQLHKDQHHQAQHYNGHSLHHISHQKEPRDHKTDFKNHDRDQQNQNSHQQIQQQLDLLECISRKSGLPRWFIATTIFASALVVLWLCFSLTAPPEDIRVVKTNVKPPENERIEDDEDDHVGGYSEKKNLLSRDDDVIKIRIENV